LGMNRTVTIVMYHYVRDLERSRFPAIKGMSLERFRRQLDYIEANFTPIGVEDIFEAVATPALELPKNSILLTFDDGYSDHFLNVFPMLDARGMKGCFFPSAQAVVEHIVLDVNKIQFVLAAVPEVQRLLEQVLSALDEFRTEYALRSREEYASTVVEEHRYDPREIILFKRLLQRELPEHVRAEIVRRLFAQYVSVDEAAFACELYASVEQIACMQRHGMHIGSHGYSHLWLDHVPRETQKEEVDRSLDFLQQAGVGTEDWTMCYPYGGFNESILQVVEERKCRLGFSVEARIANLDIDNRLALPRIDTNDLPS
jgi:peptidoglycan/xylan/chitin deacetylase (PgdA/CDA1 family)